MRKGIYVYLLIVCISIIFCCSLTVNKDWDSIIIGIGTGGLASVIIAFILEIRSDNNAKREAVDRYESIIYEIVRVYQRLMYVVVNECFGLYEKGEKHTLAEWLGILKNADLNPRLTGYKSLEDRCKAIAANHQYLFETSERIRMQKATLLYAGLEDHQGLFDLLQTLSIYCWRTTVSMDEGNYDEFIDTTLLIFEKFVEKFPKESETFKIEYNLEDFT